MEEKKKRKKSIQEKNVVQRFVRLEMLLGNLPNEILTDVSIL